MREGGDKVSHTGGDGTRASTYNCVKRREGQVRESEYQTRNLKQITKN